MATRVFDFCLVLAVCAGVSACAPQVGDDGPDDGPDAGPTRTAYTWQPIDVSGLTPRWGMYVVDSTQAAPGLPEGGALLLGGVTGTANPVVQDAAFSLSPAGLVVDATPVSTMAGGRFCHCAMLDASRDRAIIIGGRSLGAEFDTVVQVNLSSGDARGVDAVNGAADHPIGCQAVFFPELDRGYVFGGLSGALQAFSDVTYRFDADTDTFTALDIAGPPARYDADTHVMNDGTALLVGGMGATLGVLFYSDIWRFDPNTETWTQVPATSALPPGRRCPWSAVAPDESALLFGYGSDSARGESVLGDLWSFDFASQSWSTVEVQGTAPSARGFSYRWPMDQSHAGALAFGYDGALPVADAFVLEVPTALEGRWH